jgi:hypothetical protein
MAIKKEILDELLKDKDPKTMFSSDGLLGEIKKALAERVLNAEMDHHLADPMQDEVSEGDKAPSGNHRNGYSKKTIAMVHMANASKAYAGTLMFTRPLPRAPAARQPSVCRP